jgi:4-amino-4-deoxy-L-arabinose transferase-like glycosyltransferase
MQAVMQPTEQPASASRRWTWGLVVALLLAAFALRMWDLIGVPPGDDDDEMYYAMDAVRVAQFGQFELYYPTNYGHEPLFIYLEGAAFRLLGYHAFSIRYVTVVCGMLSLAGAYALARRLFSRRAALATLAFWAAIFWPVFLSRLAHRVSIFPLFTVFSMVTIWRALYDRSWRWAVAAGVLNGLTFYIYVSSRVFPAVPVAWLAALLVIDRKTVTVNWKRIVVMAALAAAIMLPLAVYMVRNPDIVNARLDTMGGPFFQIQRGRFQGLIDNFGRVAGFFTFQGDPQQRFNSNGRPIFDPISGLLFYIGGLVALSRVRRPAYALTFIWLGVMLAPTLLSTDAPSFVRADGALFPIMALAGLGTDWVWTRLQPRLPRWLTFARITLVGTAALGAFTVAVLFGEWRVMPGVMKTYNSSLSLAARYLAAHPAPASATVFIVARTASDNAPFIFGLQANDAGRVRFTSDFVWPAAKGEVWYFFCEDDLPDSAEQAWLGQPPVDREFDGAGNTVLEVYRLAAPPAPPAPAIPSPAGIDQLTNLLGVSYPQPFVRGQAAEAWLFWQTPSAWTVDTTDLPVLRLRLTSKLLVWAEGQGGLLAFPPTQWQPGDIWRQRVSFNVPADMPPQSVQPDLVVFNRKHGWPIIPAGAAQALVTFNLPGLDVTGVPVTTTVSAPLARYGNTLALLAATAQLQASPGLALWVKTTWQALGEIPGDDAVQLDLVDAAGRESAMASSVLWQGVYPTHRWQTGEEVTSNDALPVPATLAGGAYQLRMRVVDPAGQPVAGADWRVLGTAQISGRPHVFVQPPVDQPQAAVLGDVARLTGYRLNLDQARPGGSLKVTLVWQAVNSSAAPLKVFVHLYGLNDTANVLAQHDGDPAGGSAPTTGWLPGEYIEDEHIVPLDAALAPGDYRIGVGMYDPNTLQRLPVQSAAGAADVVLLTTVHIP